MIIRQIQSSDIAFIANSYLQSQRRVNQNADMSDTLYYALNTPIINYLISSQDFKIISPKEYPEIIASWICHSKSNVIHYVYTKYIFRKNNLANTLIKSINPTSPIKATHTGKIFQILKKKYNMQYDPLAIGIIPKEK